MEKTTEILLKMLERMGPVNIVKENMGETLEQKSKRFQEARNYKVNVDKYILVHVDGRSFSKLIKSKFNKPFDKDFIDMMNKTAIFLCENVQGAKIAYVQSDEITLLLKKDTPEGDVFFGGRLCKMQSIIASLATSEFNRHYIRYNIFNKDDWSEYGISDLDDELCDLKLAQFDCKVWDVDTANDAFAWFLFRNIDCVKNSKQQFAQTYLSHKELLNLNADEQIAKAMNEKGVDWNQCPQDQRFGRVISKEEFEFVGPDGAPYMRSRWVAHDGVDLTDLPTRDEFKNKYEFFK